MSSTKVRYVIGIDEVGRGPIAGPVTLGAVAAPEEFDFSLFDGIRDSKMLPAHKREHFYELLRHERDEGNLLYAVRSVGARVIDDRGIMYAIHVALGEVLDALKLDPIECSVLLDGGLKAPKAYTAQQTIIRGDQQEPLIMLASIAAKVTRDRKMIAYSSKYPGYSFEQHKGYGTKLHYDSIKKQGTCELHRLSFLGRERVAG